MSKLVFHEPVVVAQSTTAAILFDGYQDPTIRTDGKGALYVRFNVRRDEDTTFGLEDANPVYKSIDGGESWEKISGIYEWVAAGTKLANGDIYEIREIPLITDLPELPEAREERKISIIAGEATVYTVDELYPTLGDRVAKEFPIYRIKAGTNEIVKETAAVHWDNMPALRTYQGVRRSWGHKIACDKNGKMYMVAYSGYVLPDGTLGSKRFSVHILTSEDCGKNWYYLSTIPYLEEYNNPNCIDIEGFNETALHFAENGDIFAVMRSGSLHPFIKGDNEHPAPKLYCARSSDGGKSWKPEPFYDFGICPVSTELECGTTILVSGRPGVYVRSTDDPNFENWNDPVFLVTVPEEEVYGEYYEYSCSNTGICAYDSNTAFVTYSNFKLDAPDGKRAKSILVQKITVE